jgi:hypothetical protein
MRHSSLLAPKRELRRARAEAADRGHRRGEERCASLPICPTKHDNLLQTQHRWLVYSLRPPRRGWEATAEGSEKIERNGAFHEWAGNVWACWAGPVVGPPQYVDAPAHDCTSLWSHPSLQFRPISLWKVLYKIVSKVIANQLKVVLPEIISLEQLAFVPGRLITDNIIVAYECLHFMKRNKALKHCHCALKLDMMKACDRIEWQYLEPIMLKLGFSNRWGSLVMSMVNSVSYSVLFNGKKLDEFKPMRGIRQGDPISPYLFLLEAEGRSGLLKSRDQSSQLSGLQVALSTLPVNHWLFADDSLLFFKANGAGATEVSNLLQSSCQASGQKINNNKSSVFFGKGCLEILREEVKVVLNVQTETLNERYLGMPSDIGSSKMGAFKYLKDILWGKVKGWIEKMISVAGKEILIKSVAQAVPVYSMSCFKLP